MVARVIDLTDPIRESAAESLTFGWIVEAGLPVPVCQAGVLTDSGVFFPDFWWEDLGLAGECDGAVKYAGSPDADEGVLVRQAERERALRAAGFVVVRWTASEVMAHPYSVIARLEAAFDACGWRL
jgi:hypothetical protein